ncbi:MAG: M48 family metalloprotease [Pseudomonadota bacterium]|nr:M48 family metalloprotease [Pseudomonadota bacterium]
MRFCTGKPRVAISSLSVMVALCVSMQMATAQTAIQVVDAVPWSPPYRLVEPPPMLAEEQYSIALPDLGSAPNLFQQQQERKIGEAILRELNRQAPVFDDPWVQDELRILFHQMSAEAGVAAPVAFMVIRDPQINAFAVPGGLVAMHTGLILSARNLDEVAGVMAHEVAHVSQRHFSRRQEDLRYSKWLPLGGLLAGLLLSRTDIDAGSAVATGAQALAANNYLSYSRDQEREADRIGMQLMYAAGFAPSAMSDFFDVMQQRQSMGVMSVLPDFLLTHPLGQERMSEARLRASQYPARVLTQGAAQLNFQVMKGRVAALTDAVTVAALKPQAARDDAGKLTLATRYQMERQFEPARQLVADVRQRRPEWLIANLVAAEVELAADQPQVAIEILLPMLQIMPENRALILRIAEAYIAANQPEQAIAVLLPLSRRFPQDVLIWQALHQATLKLPESTPYQSVSLLRYRAEELFWRGQMDQAIVSLERAVVLAEQSDALKAQVAQRIQQMREDRKQKL